MTDRNEALESRYRFLMALLIDRGVLTDKRYRNGTWSLQGIYGVDDSGLRGAGLSPEQAIDNAIAATRLDPNDRLTHWQETHAALATPAPAQPESAQEGEPVVLKREVESALAYVLWHHQGGSSKVGQPIRRMLGIGKHARLTARQVGEAKRVQAAFDVAAGAAAPVEGAAWVAQQIKSPAQINHCMLEALQMLVGNSASHSLCQHEEADAFGRVKGTWSVAAEAKARAALKAALEEKAHG